MKVVFHKTDNTRYEREITKVTCGNGYYIWFYADGWYHPMIVYDIPLGVAKVYNPKENVDNYREIRGIRNMEILA